MVDLYDALQKATEPILKRHKLTERQRLIIWEEGWQSEWSVSEGGMTPATS